jgi:hypothetical protein
MKTTFLNSFETFTAAATSFKTQKILWVTDYRIWKAIDLT